MIGDIFSDILGDVFTGGKPSQKAQVLIRVLFGLVGVVVSTGGIIKIISDDAGLAFRLAGVFLFAMLGCFCPFNIVFFRKWKWPV